MKNVMKFSGFGVLFLVLVLLYLRYDRDARKSVKNNLTI